MLVDFDTGNESVTENTEEKCNLSIELKSIFKTSVGSI